MPFCDHVPQLSDISVVESFITDNTTRKHHEYIREIRGTFEIDPSSGFVIDQDGFIIEESIVFDHYGAYPYKFLSPGKTHTKMPVAVLFDHFWGMNYFHFYSDVLAKLFLILEKAPFLKRVPLVVSRKLSESKPFRFFMQFEEVSGFHWYIQEPTEVISTERVYLVQPMPYDPRWWMQAKNLAVPFLKPFEPGKKVFINRPAKSGRHIANFDEIAPIIREQGFHIEELEGKSIQQQIAIFSDASVIMSIHGAAMANMVFSDQRCQILEVMPDVFVSSHYYWLATALGLSRYDCLLGSDLEVNRILFPKGKFYLDPQKTRAFLTKTTS